MSEATQEQWKVYGYDTFARETYFIGLFATEAEAQQAVMQINQRLEKYQDAELRDSVWIVPPTTA
ncbi:hypothetical protein BegalDRAFT_1052 [Beggiatoa alba B18LD]|uniref:SPOR domain-containing protein n=1 Tax=Beggiatoa alba B18LD TaxID=395493 RepID=I3CEB2_9GAMM|nr:hypothetical protein [Beggiatoa alba]EIJ41955.1 hypothetical protein BegalDRAFT_1052 [Beggiatoa alba B18LD]